MSDVKLSDKAQSKMDSLIQLTMQANRVNPSETGRAIQQAINAMHKIVKRNEVPPDFERFSWEPTVGPVHEFTGRELYHDDYTDKDGNDLALLLAETVSGKLVVLQERVSMGKETAFVSVLEAGDHLGVMEACRWSDMARTMARKLKWSLTVEVE